MKRQKTLSKGSNKSFLDTKCGYPHLRKGIYLEIFFILKCVQ